MVAVFLLRIDSGNKNKPEGEVYYAKDPGVIHCNFWGSPKLQDYQVIIANGQKAIAKVFKENSHIHITEGLFELEK